MEINNKKEFILEIKKFDLESLNINININDPKIIMIAKRQSGRTWLIKDSNKQINLLDNQNDKNIN